MPLTPHKVRPINFKAEDTARIIDGKCVQERRFGSSTFDMTKAGDWLWVREPFRIVGQNLYFSPSQILAAVSDPDIAYEADILREVRKCPVEPRRASHTMPRMMSRLVLIATAVRKDNVQNISDADLAALGTTTDQYAAHWNARRHAAALFGVQGVTGRWKDNPVVTIVDFRVVEKNIDDLLANPPKSLTNSSGQKPVHSKARRSAANGLDASTPVPDAAADTAARRNARIDTNLTGIGASL